MKNIGLRDMCLDVIAYFGIGTMLLLGVPAEWKNGQKVLAVLSSFVAALMFWEGAENYINHCNGIKRFKFKRTDTGEIVESTFNNPADNTTDNTNQ